MVIIGEISAMKKRSGGKKLKQAKAALRDFALGFPGAREEFPWGERVVKVGKKVFVFLGMADGDELGLSVKLLRPGQERMGVRALRGVGRPAARHAARVDRRELPGGRAPDHDRETIARSQGRKTSSHCSSSSAPKR